MGNKNSNEPKTVVINPKDITDNDNFGCMLRVTQTKDDTYTLKLKDTEFFFDFGKKISNIHKDDKIYNITNITLHRYKNVLEEEIPYFIVKYKGYYTFFFIQSFILYKSNINPPIPTINDYSTLDFIIDSKYIISSGNFVIDEDKLNSVKINKNIKR